MTQVFLDPEDPSRALIAHATEPDFGLHVGPTVVVNLHDPARCAGRPCVVHAPSEHHMRDWRLVWRDDKGVMERTCPHGVGHPDPDDAAYLHASGRGIRTTHGCDGCCRRPS